MQTRLLVRLGTALVLMWIAVSCIATYPNRNPSGERFPRVTGATLNQEPVELPRLHEGRPVLYLVGYVQDTQFDLDRWTIGLLQIEFPFPIVEVPTIPGLLAEAFGERVDEGMRSGIPSEDWSAVVTLYGRGAEPVAEFTGNQNPRNGRILLLDSRGRVRWFWDQGFSARRLLELAQTARTLGTSTGSD